MAKDWPQMTKDLSKAIGEMRGGIPEVMTAFGGLAKSALAEGVLDPKTKELIATAIAVAVRCDGCVAFHVKAAVKNGASREELLQTLAMTIYMGGGPSMIYAAQALEAYDQFAGAAVPAEA